MKLLNIILGLIILVMVSGCGKDFLDPIDQGLATTDQINQVGESSPEAIQKIVVGILNGAFTTLYEYQNQHDVFGYMSIGLAGDLMTEDMVQTANSLFYWDYQLDNRGASYRRVNATWSVAYTLVAKANEAIAKIPLTTTDDNLKHSLGQALALRALGLNIAIQRYQKTYVGNEQAKGVPIYLTGNDDKPSAMGRGTVQDVYDRMIQDLTNAVTLLEGFQRPSKMSINQNVAAGLLARVYMVTNNWEKAAEYANIGRKGTLLMTAEECKVDGFNDINNKEWMWGCDITSEITTMFASFFSHVCSFDQGYAGTVGAYKAIDKRLFNQIGTNDARIKHFKEPGAVIDGGSSLPEVKAPIYTNLKFKKVDGWLADYVYMRSAEMYLIEAEALAQMNKTGEAATVLKLLMQNRDPDWNKSTVTASDVFLQKRIELWGEGLILYDYLRLKKGINRDYPESNHSVKLDVPADSWMFIYRIPQTELDNNTEINDDDQNP